MKSSRLSLVGLLLFIIPPLCCSEHYAYISYFTQEYTAVLHCLLHIWEDLREISISIKYQDDTQEMFNNLVDGTMLIHEFVTSDTVDLKEETLMLLWRRCFNLVLNLIGITQEMVERCSSPHTMRLYMHLQELHAAVEEHLIAIQKNATPY